MNNSPSPVIPRLAATVILIRDGQKGLETLIMRRNSKANFLGGFWVFPGGAVEDQDQSDTAQQTLMNASARETMKKPA